MSQKKFWENIVKVDDNWQSDPMILDSYTKANLGYKYFLIEIDPFSKFLWLRKLKKNGNCKWGSKDNVWYYLKEKTPLQSKFFPAKFPFSKIQKKKLVGKVYFAKERLPYLKIY
jgi:hypothetical protein